MKKIIMLLCVFTLFFNTVSPAMAANEAYDHKELLEYEGYGQAMYETVVEQTSFITGQYTENKEFISGTIDEIKDYAKFWGNEFSDFVKADSLRDAVERGGGLLLTVGDFFKNFFNDYGDEYHPQQPSSGAYDEYVSPDSACASQNKNCSAFLVKSGYALFIGDSKITNVNGWGRVGMNGLIQEKYADVSFYAWSFKTPYKEFYDGNVSGLKKLSESMNGDFTNVIFLASLFGVSIRIEKENGEPVQPVEPKPNPYTDFRKYVNDNIGNVATPQPRPYLVCPGGTKIEMSISGGTFLSADGTAMLVNKDGSATVNSDICKLGWDKPVVKYIGDKAAIETPDGKWQDAETGELLDDDGGDDGSCSGVICLAGKIIDGIVGITKAITGLAKTILDGLIGIFVPKDLNFVSAEFDKIKNTFDEKLGIVGDLKVTMENFFTQENTNPLVGLEMSLPATGGKTIDVMETGLIEQHVPTLKKVMSGVLVLMTVFYLYRKITGRGGVMEK